MQATVVLLVMTAFIMLPCSGRAQVEQAIVGAWEWYSTGCDYGELVLTPETEGYARQDVFGQPAEGSVYRSFRDGMLVAQGTYLISHPQNPISGHSVDVIDITVEGTTTRFVSLWVQDQPGLLGMFDGNCDWLWTARGPIASEVLSWGALKGCYR